MEGLRELRGMVVFPAEATTRGYCCYSVDYVDYAAHLAYTTLYAIRANETYKLRRLRGQDNLHVTTRYYALQAQGYASTLAASKKSAAQVSVYN